MTLGFGGCLEVWRLAGSRRARHAERSRRVQEVNLHVDDMIYVHTCEGRNTRVIINMHVCHVSQQAGCISCVYTHTHVCAFIHLAMHVHPGVVAFILARFGEYTASEGDPGTLP